VNKQWVLVYLSREQVARLILDCTDADTKAELQRTLDNSGWTKGKEEE